MPQTPNTSPFFVNNIGEVEVGMKKVEYDGSLMDLYDDDINKIRTAVSAQPITDETRQLELRAIFGVDHELSHQEIIQRMRGLPGIVDVAKVGSAEAEAFVTLQNCAAKLGLAKGQSIVVSCPRGVIDFLEYKGTSLAILREDKYFPGVRETLYICEYYCS